MWFFSTKKTESNAYVLKLNTPDGKKLDFIFYSLDDNIKINLEFLKKIKDNLNNFLETIQNPKFEKFNKELWYNYGKSAGYFGTIKAVSILNLNKKIKVPVNNIIPIIVKNYDNPTKTSVIFN